MRSAVGAVLLFGLVTSGLPAAQKLYVDFGLGDALVEIDAATGNRRLIDLYQYPHRLVNRLPVAISPSDILFVNTTAAQSYGLFRLTPQSGQITPVSGYVDGFSAVPLGAGTTFTTQIVSAVAYGNSRAIVLNQRRGPMLVDLATGNRSVISQSTPTLVGGGVPLEYPIDLLLETSGSLLVLNEFEGLIRIDPTTGFRRLLVSSFNFILPPTRIEWLPGGRVLHTRANGGTTLFIYDLVRNADEVLSDGVTYQRGSGPAFVAIGDITTDPAGTIHVFDQGLGAIFRVDPNTGDRTIISGGPEQVGAGEPLPDANVRSRMTAGQPPTCTHAIWHEVE